MDDKDRSSEIEQENNSYSQNESEDDGDLDLSCSSSPFESEEGEENICHGAENAVAPYQFEPIASDDASSTSDENDHEEVERLNNTNW